MPRTAAAIAIFLMLITGIVVGQLRLMAGPRIAPVSVQIEKPVDTTIAKDFYDSLNHIIQTGNVFPLEALVAPGFVDHTPFSSDPGTKDSLQHYFVALHARAPRALLSVTELTGNGALVGVRIRLEGVSELTVAGLPHTYPAIDSYELLRIDEEKVVERWASASLHSACRSAWLSRHSS